MYDELLSILKSEVKPALGCTGPTSVSYAVSVAKDAVGGEAKHVKVNVDRDTYKNSISVGIPGTARKGLVIASALGAVCGDSKLGLEVLKNVTPEQEEYAQKFAESSVELDICWELEEVGLFIEAYVETENGTGHSIIERTHTNVVLIEANGGLIYKREADGSRAPAVEVDAPIKKYKVEELYNFSRNTSLDSIIFLKDALEMNINLSQAGLKENVGGRFGIGFNSFKGDRAYIRAKSITAAASDARMAGDNIPAMSCASSGNVGITASIPFLPICEEYGKSEEEMIRAICLSFLLTIYIKSHIGRLSAMCACAIAAGVGVAAGTAYLLGDSYEKVEMAINNIVGSLGGILCDGAKLGCAMKLSTAVGVAIESAYLAVDGISIPKRDGLVSDTADDTLMLLGKIAREGMVSADIVMCKAIIDREADGVF
ncbi:MAG: L-serine ammonia-lyase, iron-sulfur-dependent, subunit alpha [Clostridiaceae bacterium]|nr:L-serine ammonia-lyase, iron-sulfur-dependent, subunit alpha [Clostridiaceae bacterium]